MADKKNIEVLTAENGLYEISVSLRDKIALLSDGKIYLNQNYINDNEVINKLTFFKNLYRKDKKNTLLCSSDKTFEVPAEELRNLYDENKKLSYLKDTNQIQRDIIELLNLAFYERASDIHIELRSPSTFIYFRILGKLSLHNTLTFEHGNQICTTLYNFMTGTSANSYNPRDQQDADLDTQFLPENLSGVRVATGPTRGGNNFMVLRLLPAGQNTKLEDLGLGKSHMKGLRSCLAVHSGGLTLICGPTGSGKSTTLQAANKELLKKTKGELNLLTIEDPIEYPISVEEEVPDPQKGMVKVTYAARQIAIPSVEDPELKKEYFRKTVVASMRQDPDYIMVSEIRDLSTADAALTASNTGHPVLSTCHARNALMIPDRLIKIGADRNLLLSPGMINGLFAQHLIRELCPNCKIKLADNRHKLPADLIERLENVLKGYGDIEGVYIGSRCGSKGCGYHDKERNVSCIDGAIERTLIAEMILPDPQFYQLMREQNIVGAYDHWIKNLGGFTMMAHGLAKVKKGIVDPRDLESKLQELTEVENFEKALADVE